MGLSLSRRRFGGQLMRGFGLGVLMLGLHVWALLALDVRLINEDKILTATRILGVLVKSALAGLLIALIEEALFRGLLMGSLARGISLINAAIISSMYFALLHFFKSDLKPGFDNIHWDSGLLILSDAFSNLAEINPDAFFALFYAGLFLSCVRLIIPQGLGYCIGIHAGWVFVIKSAKTLSYVDEQSELNWLVSSYDGMIGNLSTAWISMACLWLIWRYQKNKAQQGVALTCQTEAQL
jgi:membrane protease YdiL (CAAX protease family)